MDPISMKFAFGFQWCSCAIISCLCYGLYIIICPFRRVFLQSMYCLSFFDWWLLITSFGILKLQW